MQAVWADAQGGASFPARQCRQQTATRREPGSRNRCNAAVSEHTISPWGDLIRDIIKP